jgi:hypothetical protein
MPRETEKLEAALEYERYKMPYSKLIDIAANLDCYDYDPEIKDAEDFIIAKYGSDLAKLARDGYTDFDELMKAGGGKITKYGYVARNDKPFEPVYEYTNPEQEQGMALQ